MSRIAGYWHWTSNNGWTDYDPSEGKYELMQFTGLTDKNGKEIYEGDLLEVKDSGAPTYRAPMEWTGAGFWITDARGGHYRPNAEYIEVIGNVWESPELLK